MRDAYEKLPMAIKSRISCYQYEMILGFRKCHTSLDNLVKQLRMNKDLVKDVLADALTSDSGSSYSSGSSYDSGSSYSSSSSSSDSGSSSSSSSGGE